MGKNLISLQFTEADLTAIDAALATLEEKFGGLISLEIGIRHPGRVGRLVLAATQYHQEGVHEEVHAGDFDSPRLPSQADFQEMAEAYAACAPHPEHFHDFLGKISVAANAPGQVSRGVPLLNTRQPEKM